MGLVVRRGDPGALRVYPHEVRVVVGYQIANARPHEAVHGILGEREDMLGRVLNFGGDAVAFDADGVHQQRGESERHFGLGFVFGVFRVVVVGGFVSGRRTAKHFPRFLDIGNAFFQNDLCFVLRRLGGGRSGDRCY